LVSPDRQDIKPAEVQDWINEQSDGLQAKLRNLMSAIYRFGRYAR